MDYKKETERIKAIKPQVDICYKSVSGTGMPIKIYNPDAEKNLRTGVFAIHGGGWYAIKKDFNGLWNGGWMNFQAQYYADKGYAACAASYRSIDFDESTTVFDLIDDCRDGLRFFRENADFDKLIIIGDSAGAHLALELAYDEETKADIIILANPVLDLTGEAWRYTAKNEKQLIKASPIYNIRPINTKILLLHGNMDTVVDIETTRRFAEKMQTNCPVCRFDEIYGAKHAFILSGYNSTDEQVFEYMKNIDAFIDKNI